jgi:hypothetical protein
LKEFKLPLRQGLHFSFREGDDPPGLYQWTTDLSLGARLSVNLIFIAAQALRPSDALPRRYYKFDYRALVCYPQSHPKCRWTDFISADRSSKAERGASIEREELRSLPSIYIYFESEVFYPLYDLSAFDPSRTIAERPKRQSAWSLPFTWVGPSNYLRLSGGPKVSYGTCPRRPCAVIKLRFEAPEMLEGTVPLNAEYLFPKEEPLYHALLQADVPFLAKLA